MGQPDRFFADDKQRRRGDPVDHRAGALDALRFGPAAAAMDLDVLAATIVATSLDRGTTTATMNRDTRVAFADVSD